jgi:ribosome-associated protein
MGACLKNKRGYEVAFGTEKIKILNGLFIPEEELKFTSSRSSGPGGQRVNKVSTRVTLWFDVLRSLHLSEKEKFQLLKKLPTRINKNGLLWVTAQQSRSQAANRELAIARFTELLRGALRPPTPRKKTRVPWGAQEKRLAEKRKRRQLKLTRSPRVSWES